MSPKMVGDPRWHASWVVDACLWVTTLVPELGEPENRFVIRLPAVEAADNTHFWSELAGMPASRDESEAAQLHETLAGVKPPPASLPASSTGVFVEWLAWTECAVVVGQPEKPPLHSENHHPM